MVGVDYAGRVSRFYREHIIHGEHPLEMFFRHTPVPLEKTKGQDTDSYAWLLARELEHAIDIRRLERIVQESEALNIPFLCATRDIVAPDMSIGEYAAERAGITQRATSKYKSVPVDLENRGKYRKLFRTTAFNILICERELREQEIFPDAMRMARYAAYGVAAGFPADTRGKGSDWRLIGDFIKHIIGAYEEEKPL